MEPLGFSHNTEVGTKRTSRVCSWSSDFWEGRRPNCRPGAVKDTPLQKARNPKSSLKHREPMSAMPC